MINAVFSKCNEVSSYLPANGVLLYNMIGTGVDVAIWFGAGQLASVVTDNELVILLASVAGVAISSNLVSSYANSYLSSSCANYNSQKLQDADYKTSRDTLYTGNNQKWVASNILTSAVGLGVSFFGFQGLTKLTETVIGDSVSPAIVIAVNSVAAGYIGSAAKSVTASNINTVFDKLGYKF